MINWGLVRNYRLTRTNLWLQPLSNSHTFSPVQLRPLQPRLPDMVSLQKTL